MPVTTDDLDGAMTVAQVADRLEYSYRHMLRVIRAGKIETIRLGGERGRILVTQRALTEYLNQYRHQSGRGREFTKTRTSTGRKPR